LMQVPEPALKSTEAVRADMAMALGKLQDQFAALKASVAGGAAPPPLCEVTFDPDYAKVGAGSQGSVWVGTWHSPGGHVGAAIKITEVSVASLERDMERATLEVRLMHAIDHPNVAPVWDYDLRIARVEVDVVTRWRRGGRVVRTERVPTLMEWQDVKGQWEWRTMGACPPLAYGVVVEQRLEAAKVASCGVLQVMPRFSGASPSCCCSACS